MLDVAASISMTLVTENLHRLRTDINGFSHTCFPRRDYDCALEAVWRSVSRARTTGKGNLRTRGQAGNGVEKIVGQSCWNGFWPGDDLHEARE